LNIRNQQHISFEAPHQKPNLKRQTEYAKKLIDPNLKVCQTTYQSNGIAAIMNPILTLRKSFDLSVTQVEEELKYDVFAWMRR
jgi:hypothetical protein